MVLAIALTFEHIIPTTLFLIIYAVHKNVEADVIKRVPLDQQNEVRHRFRRIFGWEVFAITGANTYIMMVIIGRPEGFGIMILGAACLALVELRKDPMKANILALISMSILPVFLLSLLLL